MGAAERSRKTHAPRKSMRIRLSDRSGVRRAEMVYQSIREAIREGSLRSGERLTEREVASILGVSRTPAREALKLLEARGMVSSVSAGGLIIADITPENVSQLYTVWEHLEGLAAKFAAQHASEIDIHNLREIHGRWDAKNAPAVLGRLNRQFHQAIYQAANNRYLVGALAGIDDSVALLGATTFAVPGRPAEVKREHAAIVDAIARHDQAAAQSAAQIHIRKAGRLRMEIMANMK
jgi:DNA-binding GntR family transcriptional regulator